MAGRPKLPIDEEQVFKLARLGCTVEEIADFLRILHLFVHCHQCDFLQRWRGRYNTRTCSRSPASGDGGSTT